MSRTLTMGMFFHGQPVRVEIGMPTEVPAKTCVGRLARIKVEGMELCGNVVDYPAGDPMHPRRVRIQFGCPALKGHVVQPHEYAFLGWADEEED